MSGKKVGRHDRMMATLDSSSSDDDTPKTKATTAVKAIKPTANPIPTVGKKKAQQAAVNAFGAALGNDDSDEDFDKSIMAKATPKPNKFKGYNPMAPREKPTEASKKMVTDALTSIEAKATSASAAPSSKQSESNKKKSLFDDGDDDDEDSSPLRSADISGISKKSLAAVESGTGTAALTVNRSYADRYDAVKRKQELQKLADKFKEEVEESDESDEEEDEFGDDLNDDAHDDMLAEVLFRLRQKDASINDKSVGFFKELNSAAAAEDGDSKGPKRHTLKDEYQRAVVGGEKYDEGANAYIEEDDRPGRLKPRTSDERQAKAAFVSAVGGAADEDDGDDIFTKKVGGKSSAELYGADASGKKPKAEKKTKGKLAKAFSAGVSSDASKEEQMQEAFLQSFFTNEKWRDDADEDSDDAEGEYTGGGINRKGMKKGDVNWEQLAKEDQDEMFFDEAEQWEKEFQNKQFHHEMVEAPEDLQIKSFARRATTVQTGAAAGTLKSIHGGEEEAIHTVISGGDGLLRKQESSRKEQRKRRAERAAEAEAQRLEELKRLKTLKRMEIEEKRDMIARVAGFLKGGSNTNTNDASLENFDLENPFAVNSSDPKDQNKKKKNKKNAPAPAEGNQKLLSQLSSIWTNEELEKDFDSADFDKKMAALFDTDEFNNDIDEDEIAKIRAEIDDNDINFGEDSDDDDADAEELAEKLLAEDVGVGYGDEENRNGDGLFYSNGNGDDEDDDGDSDGVLDDAELFGSLQNVMKFDKKKSKKNQKASQMDEEDDAAAALYGSSNKSTAAADEDDDLTALLYPSTVLSKMEKEKAEKTKKEKKGVSAVEISQDSKKRDIEDYLKVLQNDLDTKVDEYDKLHYDKVLSGGLKTRFRYRTVPAESFGLTDEDILTKDDRTLNMIAPMKLYAAYLGPKENKRDRQRCIARLQNLRKLDPTRRSRKYGDVSKTILFDTNVSEEDGKAMAARVRLSTRKLLASNDAEDAVAGVEQELKEDRQAKKAAKAEKRPREAGGEEEVKASQPPVQKKPFEGRGGFRGGRGGGSNFSHNSSSNNSSQSFSRGRGQSFGATYRGNGRGRGFSPRGRGSN